MNESYTQPLTADDWLKIINKKRQVLDLGTAIDITARTNTRELPRELSSRSREELNNKRIKEYNNASRKDSEDDEISKSPVYEKPRVITEPREVSSRFTGIYVQQAITKSGIKLFLTLQNTEWAELTEKLKVTAELKRYDRLREIRSLTDDSSEFCYYLEDQRRLIHELKDHRLCMGRMHHTGKRAKWVKNALVTATVVDDVVEMVNIYIEGEEYDINLDGILTPNQTKIYRATGQYGVIKNITGPSPSIWDLPRSVCK
jgi:hypothetical protein